MSDKDSFQGPKDFSSLGEIQYKVSLLFRLGGL